MKRYLFSSAAAVLCAGSLIAAQAPASQSPQEPSQPGAQPQPQTQTPSPQSPATPAPRPSTQAAAGTTTVTGCVYNEEDVPGRSPNVAERAGVLEDYILADVRPSPAAGATGTSGAAGAGAVGAGGAGAGATAGTSGAGSGTMYKLELISDDRLKSLVGKRVEVTGRIDREAGDSGGRPQGTTGAGAPGAGAAGAGAGAAGGAQPGRPAEPADAQADRSPGPDRIELPEFEVTSIREMAGTCPATPAGN